MVTVFCSNWSKLNLFWFLYFFWLETSKSYVNTLSGTFLILYLPNRSGFLSPFLCLPDNLILLREKKEYIHHFHNLLASLASFYPHTHLFACAYILLVPSPYTNYYYIANKSLLLVFLQMISNQILKWLKSYFWLPDWKNLWLVKNGDIVKIDYKRKDKYLLSQKRYCVYIKKFILGVFLLVGILIHLCKCIKMR